MERFTIPMKLPSLNEYTLACRRNKFAGARMKKEIEQAIGLYLMKMPRYHKPIKINFTWVESTKKRDLDNISFAKKFILDAMVKYEKILNDNPRFVQGFTDTWVYGNKNEVIIEIEEMREENV